MVELDLISFDADQTLFAFQKVLEEPLTTVADFLSTQLKTKITSGDLQNTRDRIASRFPTSTIDMLEIRRLSFAECTNSHPQSDELVEEAMKVFKKNDLEPSTSIQASLKHLANCPELLHWGSLQTAILILSGQV